MWWKTILRQRPSPAPPTTSFDEALLRRLERLALQASRTLRGGVSGMHPSQRRLPAPTFSDHRPYVASDDLRYVDWNAYARQEHLFVKLGEADQDLPVHLILDRSASMDYGTGDQHKLHYGKLLLAALGYVALANGDHLYALAADTTTTQPFGPARNKQRGPALLQYAAAITPAQHGALQQAVERYTRSYQGGLLVLLSDGWALGDLPLLLQRIAPPRWQVLFLHLLHHDELEPHLHGRIELQDSETNQHTTLQIDQQVLAQYHARIQAWCRTLETTCHQRGASYARITTGMPLEQAAIPYLRQRKLLT